MKNEKAIEKLIAECAAAISTLRASGDQSMTTWVPLDRFGNNDWAIVFGWVDDYEPKYSEDGKGSCVNGKVAYQSCNSIMQEFDTDWVMPYDEYGNVDDTMISIGNPDPTLEIEWLIENWIRIRAKLIDQEDREAEYEYIYS